MGCGCGPSARAVEGSEGPPHPGSKCGQPWPHAPGCGCSAAPSSHLPGAGHAWTRSSPPAHIFCVGHGALFCTVASCMMPSSTWYLTAPHPANTWYPTTSPLTWASTTGELQQPWPISSAKGLTPETFTGEDFPL